MISVIIPAYNAEATIKRAIDSIVNQEFHDVEVVIIDDGSTDNTYNICKSIAEQDSKVRIFHQDNCGVSTARNCGIKQARGDYIIFLDSDDELSPKSLQELNAEINKYFPDVIVYGIEYKSDDKTLISVHPDYNYADIKSNLNLLIQHVYKKGLFASSVNKAYNRKLLIGLYFDITKDYAEDLIFNFEVFCYIKSLLCISCDLYIYNKHDNSLSTNNTISHALQLKEIETKARDFFRRLNVAEGTTQDLIAGHLYEYLYPLYINMICQMKSMRLSQKKLLIKEIVSEKYKSYLFSKRSSVYAFLLRNDLLNLLYSYILLNSALHGNREKQ